MSLSFLEKLPDINVRDDITNYYKDIDYLNYKPIFYHILEGNIIYPECYLYPNKDEINLYSGFCKNGYYNKVTYKIEEKKYIFYREENEIESIFNTSSWNEMYSYINIFFNYYIK